MKIDGKKDVLAMIAARSLKGKKVAVLTCGYSAEHAVPVHEDMEAHHPNGGQAKFLEQPAREKQQEMADAVARSVAAKNGLAEGLARAGEVLKAASVPLVPVDTGELRDSWFARVD